MNFFIRPSKHILKSLKKVNINLDFFKGTCSSDEDFLDNTGIYGNVHQNFFPIYYTYYV